MQQINPILAANSLGPALIGCGVILITLTISLLRKAMGLAFPLKNPRSKKSSVRTKITHFQEVKIKTRAITSVIKALVLTTFSSTLKYAIGHESAII